MRLYNTINWPIALSSLLLISIGILVIYSSSQILAFQQSLFVVVGFLGYIIVSQLNYKSFHILVLPIYLFTLLLLLVVFILGVETRGVLRWIPIGSLNIQPSEFAKIALIIFLADFWVKRMPTIKNILLSLSLTAPFIILIFRQPDLGSALTVAAIWLGMLFASGVSFKKVAVVILISILFIPAGLLLLEDYQKLRIAGFLAPHADPLGTGYNLIQSTIAVGSGQLWGRGLGQGTQSRLRFLPEYRTDFIFASIAEEMGFVGASIILFSYLILLIYCLRVSWRASDFFGSLIAAGVSSQLLFQGFVNIGMNLGLLPITGITLPLVSYGGSSLVATLMSLGFVSSVAKSERKIDID